MDSSSGLGVVMIMIAVAMTGNDYCCYVLSVTSLVCPCLKCIGLYRAVEFTKKAFRGWFTIQLNIAQKPLSGNGFDPSLIMP